MVALNENADNQSSGLFPECMSSWLDRYIDDKLGNPLRQDFDDSIQLGLFLEGDTTLDIATFYDVVLPCRYGRCNASVIIFPPAEETRLWTLVSLLPFDCEVKTYPDRVTLFVMPWEKKLAEEMRGEA